MSYQTFGPYLIFWLYSYDIVMMRVIVVVSADQHPAIIKSLDFRRECKGVAV
jgi:hypothetical protein